MKNSYTRQGFTLIELLVVVLIIGILSAIALPKYRLAVAKSHYAELIAITKAIKNAQEVYYLEHGQYATTPEDLPISLPDGTTEGKLPWGTKALKLPSGKWIRLYSTTNFGTAIVSTDVTTLCNNYGIILDHSEQNAGKPYCAAHYGTTCDVDFGLKVCKLVGAEKTIPNTRGNFWF